jgi:hypothetical protein
VDYPFNNGARPIGQGFVERLRTAYETWRVISRERRDRQDVPLSPLRLLAPLQADDLPLVFITHNDIVLLPSLLQHYRRLGVTRFICVDDVSGDGTREFLLEQPDVDVWVSSIRFGEARRGRRWREKLFSLYGYDRWYLNIDSDEFLIYDRCFDRPLKDLIRLFEAKGVKRLAAPMLDMYAGPDETSPSPDAMPWTYSRYFDGAGYELTKQKRGISIKGGPRRRRFAEENELIKYPLIYWDERCFFGSSLHRPLPYDRNFPELWGNLLHFKFFTNYRQKIVEAAEGGQHYDGSKHYQAMKTMLDREGGIDFSGDMSVAYDGPQQLVERGFMSRIVYGQ